MVEEEEDESDKASSDGLGDSNPSNEDSESGESEDSSDAGGEFVLFSTSMFSTNVYTSSPDLGQFDPRARGRPDASSSLRASGPSHQPHVKQARLPKLVPMRPQTDASHSLNDHGITVSFGDRRKHAPSAKSSKSLVDKQEDHGLMEMSWMPTTSSKDDEHSDDDAQTRSKPKGKRKGVESFGAGMEKGVDSSEQINEASRTGRSKRRSGVRSGSRNAFRNL